MPLSWSAGSRQAAEEEDITSERPRAPKDAMSQRHIVFGHVRARGKHAEALLLRIVERGRTEPASDVLAAQLLRHKGVTHVEHGLCRSGVLEIRVSYREAI